MIEMFQGTSKINFDTAVSIFEKINPVCCKLISSLY